MGGKKQVRSWKAVFLYVTNQLKTFADVCRCHSTWSVVGYDSGFYFDCFVGLSLCLEEDEVEHSPQSGICHLCPL